MGIWDKGELLGGERLDEVIPEGEPFILYGMKYIGEVDLDNNMPPAKKTVLLFAPAARDSEKGYVAMAEKGLAAGILSDPIAVMAQNAEDGDFPCVCVHKRVETKAGNEAKVLERTAKADRISDEFLTLTQENTPNEWLDL